MRSSGRTIAAIAHELGIGESNLSYWLKKDQESRAVADPGRFEAGSAQARENAALRRRVAELEVEREILKRATALGEGVARVRIFAFVAAQKAGFPVSTLCRSARSRWMTPGYEVAIAEVEERRDHPLEPHGWIGLARGHGSRSGTAAWVACSTASSASRRSAQKRS